MSLSILLYMKVLACILRNMACGVPTITWASALAEVVGEEPW